MDGWMVVVVVLPQHKVILFVGGLVRGAITWAQALQIDTPHKGMITAVTFCK